jgi:hypothetical protein
MGDLSWILGKHNEPARQAEIVAPGHRRASVMVDQSRPLVRAGAGEQSAPMNSIRCGRQDGLDGARVPRAGPRDPGFAPLALTFLNLYLP